MFNYIILTILALSVFMVLSVFVAIPYMNEVRKPSIYTHQKLDTAFAAMVKAQQSFQTPSDAGPLIDINQLDPKLLLVHNAKKDTSAFFSRKKDLSEKWAEILESRKTVVDKLKSYDRTYKERESGFRQK